LRANTERPVEAVVCIPTFRRPEGLARTLRSLLEQQGDVAFGVVVVENDAENPVGAQSAESILADSDLPSIIKVEPQQGNCHAINHVFTEARNSFPSADYFLMIDDDEVAESDWLAQMVATARRTGADIVGGPVIRRFDVPVPESISQHGLYGYIAGPTRQVPIIHGTGNCLIRRKVFSGLDSELFDTAFNFLGGGDMDFFVRCQSAGFVFWWCEEAVIHETVAEDRTTANWLMRRSIRTGSINYVINRKYAQTGKAIAWLQVKNILSLGLGFFHSLEKFASTGRLLPATHPFLMSVGRTTASLGFLPVPYKASAIQPSRTKEAILVATNPIIPDTKPANAPQTELHESTVTPAGEAADSLANAHAKLLELLPHGEVEIYEAGGGASSYLPASLIQRARVTVVDIDPTQISNNSYAQTTIEGDVQTYDFPANSVDLVTTYNVIEHLEFVDAAVTRFAKALRPGGLLFIGAPYPRSLSGYVTKYSPHWFHVWFYKNIRGHERAGLPGEPPFPVFYHPLVLPERLKHFLASFGLEVVYERVYESPRFAELRTRLPLLSKIVDATTDLARFITFGRMDLRKGDYHLILRKL